MAMMVTKQVVTSMTALDDEDAYNILSMGEYVLEDHKKYLNQQEHTCPFFSYFITN